MASIARNNNKLKRTYESKTISDVTPGLRCENRKMPDIRAADLDRNRAPRVSGSAQSHGRDSARVARLYGCGRRSKLHFVQGCRIGVIGKN
jgi:hypothetical protein